MKAFTFFIFILSQILSEVCEAAELTITDVYVPYISGALIEVDGLSKDKFWPHALGLTLDYEISPRYVERSNWKTEVKVFHNGKSIFFFILSADPNPERIVSVSSERDAVFGEDKITLLFDATGIGRRAYALGVNASGAKFDSITSSYNDSSPNWSGEWYAKTKITKNGYQAEFEIPFTTINLLYDEVGNASFGLNIERFIARDRKEILSLAAIDIREQCKACQFVMSRISDVTPPESTWRITPYLLASSNRTYEGAISSTERFSDAGIDLLWNRNSTDKILVTLNPDFSQVEIDQIQFDINRRFPIIFPERRPFFTEDTGLFSTGLSILNTRNLFDPNYGLQITRRIKNASAGVMYIKDSTTTFIMPDIETSKRITFNNPSDNHIGRIKYKFPKRISIGGLFTNKKSTEGYENSVLGLDGVYEIGERHRFSWGAFGSSTKNPELLQNMFGVNFKQSGFAGTASHSFTGDVYSSFTSYREISRHFRADLGTVHQVGVRNMFHKSSLKFANENLNEKFVSWSTGYSFSSQYSTEGNLLRKSHSWNVFGSTKKDSFMFASATRKIESFESVEFGLNSFSLSYSFVPKDRLKFSLNLNSGEFIYLAGPQKGESNTFNFSLKYSSKSSFTGSVSLGNSKFDLHNRSLFSVKSINIDAKYHISLKNHINLKLSYGDLINPITSDQLLNRSSNLAYQLLYRYQPSAFTNLVFGISGNSFGSQGFQELNPTRLFIFSKLSYSF